MDVLLRVYAKCIHGQQEAAKRRIEDAMRSADEDTQDEDTEDEHERPD